jgi:hypothetical protein
MHFQNLLRRGKLPVSKQRLKPVQNCTGGFPVQLLVGDGVNQGLKRRDTPGLNPDVSELSNQPLQDRVHRLQMVHRSSIHLQAQTSFILQSWAAPFRTGQIKDIAARFKIAE